ncbi:uncharacterized protein PRCAT00005053001 [Priceomyces carsonii]|uniref:uncharacterized protein n=1 Tax=Priceomyces carsonii TaxID=28549 RepID=UPI002ED81E3F|nr:unnamed protein product [Priceomyces carsonii]
MIKKKDTKYTLNNNTEIPITAFGLYLTAPDITSKVVYEALEVGYRHIDSAAYHSNEEEAARESFNF